MMAPPYPVPGICPQTPGARYLEFSPHLSIHLPCPLSGQDAAECKGISQYATVLHNLEQGTPSRDYLLLNLDFRMSAAAIIEMTAVADAKI